MCWCPIRCAAFFVQKKLERASGIGAGCPPDERASRLRAGRPTYRRPPELRPPGLRPSATTTSAERSESPRDSCGEPVERSSDQTPHRDTPPSEARQSHRWRGLRLRLLVLRHFSYARAHWHARFWTMVFEWALFAVFIGAMGEVRAAVERL